MVGRRVAARHETHGAARRGELERVAEDVEQDLVDGPRVPMGAALHARDVADDGHPLVLGVLADQSQGEVDRILRIAGPVLQFPAPGLDLGQVEDIVDEAQQMGAGIVDVAGIVPVARRAVRAELFRLQDLGEADDRVERGAQLVAHRRQEAGFGAVRGFRLGPGDLQVARAGHLRGDVAADAAIAREPALRIEDGHAAGSREAPRAVAGTDLVTELVKRLMPREPRLVRRERLRIDVHDQVGADQALAFRDIETGQALEPWAEIGEPKRVVHLPEPVAGQRRHVLEALKALLQPFLGLLPADVDHQDLRQEDGAADEEQRGGQGERLQERQPEGDAVDGEEPGQGQQQARAGGGLLDDAVQAAELPGDQRAQGRRGRDRGRAGDHARPAELQTVGAGQPARDQAGERAAERTGEEDHEIAQVDDDAGRHLDREHHAQDRRAAEQRALAQGARARAPAVQARGDHPHAEGQDDRQRDVRREGLKGETRSRQDVAPDRRGAAGIAVPLRGRD